MKIKIVVLYIIAVSNVFPLVGCTTIGFSNSAKLARLDFGQPTNINVCILRDREVTQKRVDEIMGAVNQEFNRYGIQFTVPWVRKWERPGFWSTTILSDVILKPLSVPCDRLFAFAERTASDRLWEILLPEIAGAVETITSTKGFAFADWLLFDSPESVATHEFYHFFGCKHALVMDSCYEQIKKIKDIAAGEKHAGNDFFPTISQDGRVLKSRDEVDNEFYQLILNHNIQTMRE
jgi:hypothetical protein